MENYWSGGTMRPRFKPLTKNQRRMKLFRAWLKTDEARNFAMFVMMFLITFTFMRLVTP